MRGARRTEVNIFYIWLSFILGTLVSAEYWILYQSNEWKEITMKIKLNNINDKQVNIQYLKNMHSVCKLFSPTIVRYFGNSV